MQRDESNAAAMKCPSAHPRVFISYSRDAGDHKERILRLSARLRKGGIETSLDQYVPGTPQEGWPRWMLNQIDWADFVLLVCTEIYYRRFRGFDTRGNGKGVDWEGAIMTQQIYDARGATVKFVPVLFDNADARFIPEPLRGHTFYVLTSEQAYQDLCDFLLGRSGVVPDPIGKPKLKPRRCAASLDLRIRSGGRIAPVTVGRFNILGNSRWRRVVALVSLLCLFLGAHIERDKPFGEQGLATLSQQRSASAGQVHAQESVGDQRIVEMEQALAAWQAKRGKVIAQRVIVAYPAVASLDRTRLTYTQAITFQQLEVAYRIITKEDGGPWAGARDQVPILVVAATEGIAPAAVAFTGKLRANGFYVADSREEAELIVELTGDPFVPGPRYENLYPGYGGLVEVSLHARWVYDGSTFLLCSHKGRGNSSNPQIAATNAYRNAANEMFRDFLAQLPPRQP